MHRELDIPRHSVHFHVAGDQKPLAIERTQVGRIRKSISVPAAKPINHNMLWFCGQSILNLMFRLLDIDFNIETRINCFHTTLPGFVGPFS